MNEGLSIERPSDGVVELRLDRAAQRNALDTATLTALHMAIVELGEDRDARVVVLSGAGATFCAGADLREFAGDKPPDPADTLARVRLVVRVIRGLLDLEAVTIAAVHGAAVGAGWGLALGCDLCWAADETTFSLPEVAKGYRLPRIITERLIEVVGPVVAAEIILTGSALGVEELRSIGAVTRTATDGDALRVEAIEFASQLASLPRSVLRAATDPLRAASSGGVVPEIDYQWPER